MSVVVTSPSSPAGQRPAGAKSLTRAGVVGATLASAIFLAVLLRGHPSLLQEPRSQGAYFDAQAHSFLDTRWDVPADAVSFEGFEIDGRLYMYFGPLPALLRLPVAAVTDDLDGRLGQLSMLLAFAAAMWAIVGLTARARPLVRGASPVSRAEQWFFGGFVFLLGAGSVLTFLASESWVYHEATLWGFALALAAFDRVLAWVISPSSRDLVLATALTSAALVTRGTSGAGPLAALGIALVMSRSPGLRRIAGIEGHRRITVAPLALAVVLPLALYAYVNQAKFGSFFSIPWTKQISNTIYPAQNEILVANGGSRFNPKLIPTNVVQYFRPDGTAIRSLFPWVGFGAEAIDIGDVRTERTGNASWFTSMPLLTALAGTGLVGLLRARPSDRPSLTALRVPAAGALVGCVPTLAFSSLSQRYMVDFLPLAVILAAAGLHVVVRWADGNVGPRRLAAVVFGLLTALSLWVNVGLAVAYQRLAVPATHFTDASLGTDRDGRDLASFVAFQYDLHDRFPGGRPPYVTSGDRLPAPPDRAGETFVLGDCAALYWAGGDARAWRVVERSEDGGLYRLRVRFPDRPTDWEPLLVNGRGADAQHLAVRVLGGDRLQVAYQTVFTADPIPIRPGELHDVDVLVDAVRGSAATGTVRVTVDGVTAWDATVPNSIITDPLQPLDSVTIGRATDVPDLAPSFSGSIERRPAVVPLCRELVDRSG